MHFFLSVDYTWISGSLYDHSVQFLAHMLTYIFGKDQRSAVSWSAMEFRMSALSFFGFFCAWVQRRSFSSNATFRRRESVNFPPYSRSIQFLSRYGLFQVCIILVFLHVEKAWLKGEIRVFNATFVVRNFATSSSMKKHEVSIQPWICLGVHQPVHFTHIFLVGNQSFPFSGFMFRNCAMFLAQTVQTWIFYVCISYGIIIIN